MSLIEQLTKTLASQIAEQASAKTGLDQTQAQNAIPAVVASLLGGMKKNVAQPDGANALASALSNHDGGLLDQISNLSDDNVLNDGQKIIGHLLGGKQQQAQQALATANGAQESQMADLFAMVAPALMASLGKAKQDQGLDVNALAGLINNEGQAAAAALPNELGGLMKFIDQDGDGDFKDDLIQAAGSKLLGGLFGKK